LRIKQWTNQEGLSIVKDRAFLTLMRKTLKEISFKATTTVTEKELIESALMTLVNIQRTYDAMTLRRESAILNTAKYELNIWKHNPSVLAQQMTLLDRQLIKTICGSEFLHGAHMKAELSPNYHQMVQKFNQISNWVAHEIVSQRDMSERVEALQYFIKLTKELVALSNYNSAYAVYLGLSMQVVTRLTLTWDKLNKKHTLRHKRLARLFDMNFNFHEYRKNLEADKEKCPIPVLALIPKDIIRFETDSTLTKNGQVDMEKMKGIWHGYFFLRQSQNNINICSIQRVEDVFRFFSDSSFEVSEKELNKLSKKCEPKTIKATKKASVH
jgi:transcription antitermination factor NusG